VEEPSAEGAEGIQSTPATTAGLAGRAFIVLCVISFLSGFFTAPFGSLFPVYIDADLGEIPFYTGYLRAVMLALGGIFAVVAGRLCDLVGLKPILLLGLLGSVITGLVFQSSSIWLLTLLVVIMGASSGHWSTAGQSYLIVSAGARRLGLGGALYFLSSTAGGSLGSVVTGLVKPMWSFQELGMGMTAAMVAVFALAVLLLPSGTRPAPSGGSGLGLWSAYRPLLQRREVHLLVGLRLSITGFWGMASFLLPLLVYRVSNDPSTTAYFTALSLAVACGGQLLTGVLRDRYGRFWPLLIPAAGIVLSAALLGVYTKSLMGLFVFGTALTTTAWAVSTLVPSLIAEVASPEEKSRLVGLGHMAWSTAMVGGSLAGGLLVEIDASLPFFIGAAMAAVGTSCAFFLCRRLDAPGRSN
jgi:MFS family permease